MANKPLSAKLHVTLYFIVSAACTAALIISPGLTDLSLYFDIPVKQSSKVVSIFLLGYVLGLFFHSYEAKRSGYRKTLFRGFVIYNIGNLLQILSIKFQLYDPFLLSRLLSSIGASSGLICVFAMIPEISRNTKETQRLISNAFISLTLASYLSITVGGFLTYYLGWMSIIGFTLCLSTLNIVMILKYIPKVKPENSINLEITVFIKKYTHAFFNSQLLRFSVISSFTTCSSYLYNSLGSLIAMNIFHMSPRDIGIISILNLIAIITGSRISTALSKQLDSFRSLSIGVFLSSAPIALIVLLAIEYIPDNLIKASFFLSVLLINISTGIIYPQASFLALKSTECKPTASSIMNIFKIGIPCIVIFLAGRSSLSLELSFYIPMSIFFLITSFCTIAAGLFIRQQS
mgnify:CR=1 FL=1